MHKFKQVLVIIFIFSILLALSYCTGKAPSTAEYVKFYKVKDRTEDTRVLKPKQMFNEVWSLVDEDYWDEDLNKQDWGRWKKRYANKIKDDDDAYVAINSMLTSLDDPYSKYLNKQEFDEQNDSVDSKIYGIGVNVASFSGKIFIINVVKGAPADINGLKQGDMLLSVNGNKVSGNSVFQVATFIKGAPDSTVTLEVLRDNKVLLKKIKRAEIKVKTVESEVIDNEIGYIKILSFIGSSTPVEFIDALNKIKDTKALVLDLRGNPGGLFQNAIFVANMFLNDGRIVDVIGRGGDGSSYIFDNKEYIYENPLAILVDGDTASASEIVSGALKDNKRAVIIGTTTFGKGLVQKVYAMPNKTGLNLTIARYLTPDGSDINKKGIQPNYRVEITKNDWEKGVDTQLVYAKNILRNEVARKTFAKAGN